MRWILSRSGPRILIPTGVRTPDREHVYPGLDRHGPGVYNPRNLHGLIQAIRSIDQVFGARGGRARALRKMSFSHSGAQSEYQVGIFGHSDCGLRTITVSIMEKGRRVCGRFGPSGLTEHPFDFRERFEDFILDLEHMLRFGYGNARDRCRHV